MSTVPKRSPISATAELLLILFCYFSPFVAPNAYVPLLFIYFVDSLNQLIIHLSIEMWQPGSRIGHSKSYTGD